MEGSVLKISLGLEAHKYVDALKLPNMETWIPGEIFNAENVFWGLAHEPVTDSMDPLGLRIGDIIESECYVCLLFLHDE